MIKWNIINNIRINFNINKIIKTTINNIKFNSNKMIKTAINNIRINFNINKIIKTTINNIKFNSNKMINKTKINSILMLISKISYQRINL